MLVLLSRLKSRLFCILMVKGVGVSAMCMFWLVFLMMV